MATSISYMRSTTRKPSAVLVRCMAVLSGAVHVCTCPTSAGRSA